MCWFNTKWLIHLMLPAINEALGTLPAAHRDVIVRAYFRHNTTRQIAAELNLSARRVSCRIYQAKRKFRRICDQVVGMAPV